MRSGDGGETVESDDSEMFQAPRLCRAPSGEGDWINTSVSTSADDSHGLDGETGFEVFADRETRQIGE